MLKYLDCIELLRLALQTLRKGQRDQVPMSRMPEVSMLVTQSLNRTDDGTVKTYLLDVVNGINVAQQNTAIQFLPASMKEVLVQGIENVLVTLCDNAYTYYEEHDVPLEHKELLRTVVEYHLFKGSVT